MGFLIITLALFIIGFIFGRINERRHLTYLDREEKRLSHIMVTDIKTIPDTANAGHLVMGSSVISMDYFKRIISIWRVIFGGELRMFSSLTDRARRQSVLRMKEQAEVDGATAIYNVRIQTSAPFQSSKHIGAIELYAYGTALYL